jgi:hypothetical protein
MRRLCQLGPVEPCTEIATWQVRLDGSDRWYYACDQHRTTPGVTETRPTRSRWVRGGPG